MKTYVLILSQQYPKTHSLAGKPTDFITKFLYRFKKHTIRGNYELWAKRFEQINNGKACLSVRIWSGKPYRSNQAEIIKLTNLDGIGIQKLTFQEMLATVSQCIITKSKDGNHIFVPDIADLDILAINDGLDPQHFKEWFANYDLSQPLAIIHFTSFRY